MYYMHLLSFRKWLSERGSLPTNNTISSKHCSRPVEQLTTNQMKMDKPMEK